jgi:hypothetical protein
MDAFHHQLTCSHCAYCITRGFSEGHGCHGDELLNCEGVLRAQAIWLRQMEPAS